MLCKSLKTPMQRKKEKRQAAGKESVSWEGQGEVGRGGKGVGRERGRKRKRGRRRGPGRQTRGGGGRRGRSSLAGTDGWGRPSLNEARG